MKFSVKTIVTAIAASVVLSACSKYPSDGVVDTRSVREIAEVLEVTGEVYGVKSGGLKAIQNLYHDRNLLSEAQGDVWEKTYKKETIIEFEPKYITADKFNASIAQVKDQAEELLRSVQAEIGQELSAAEQDLKTATDNLAAVEDKIGKYKAIAGDTEEIVAALNKEKDRLIAQRNDIIKSAKARIDEIAKANGLSALSRNPLSRYSSRDVTPEQSSSCADYKGRLKVNLIKEQSKCLYFTLPDELMVYNKEITGILQQVSIALHQVEEKLGKQGSWMVSATGIYAQIKQTKADGEEAKSKAQEAYGRLYKMEYQQRNFAENKERLTARVTELKSDEYYNNRMSTAFFNPSVDHSFSFEQARTDIFNEYFVKAAEIEITENRDGVFTDVSGDFELLVVHSDILAAYRGGRDAAKSIDFIDLTSEQVTEADQLEVKINRRELMRSRQEADLDRFVQEVFSRAIDYLAEKA